MCLKIRTQIYGAGFVAVILTVQVHVVLLKSVLEQLRPLRLQSRCKRVK